MGKRQFLNLRSGQVSKQKKKRFHPQLLKKCSTRYWAGADNIEKGGDYIGQFTDESSPKGEIRYISWSFKVHLKRPSSAISKHIWKWLKRIFLMKTFLSYVCYVLVLTGNRPRRARSSLDWASSEYHQEILIKEINNNVLPEIKMIYVLWTLCFRNFIWDSKN